MSLQPRAFRWRQKRTRSAIATVVAGAAASALFLCVLAAGSVSAVAQISIPPLTSPVIDMARVLPAQFVHEMSARLEAYYAQTGYQIQVLTIPSLEGEAIEDTSIRILEAWKLGRRKEGSGVLIMAAIANRQVRIEVGDGLEGLIPDARAGRIISEDIVPEFRAENYAGGISLAIVSIADALGAPIADIRVSRTARASRERPTGGFGGVFVFLFIFVMFIAPQMFGKRGRRAAGRGSTGRTLFWLWLLSMFLGGGRGGGFGGRGGGGWSGGGGGFSGGGASGGW